MIMIRKVTRATKAAMPRWLVIAFAACLVIPGPFDELGALLITAALCTAQPIRARRAASAWRGGKSHRGQVTS